jgi:MoxR-like ATPase
VRAAVGGLLPSVAMTGFARFSGTSTYIAADDLQRDVNAAIALSRPLLVKGEPGTGKTLLAHAIAEALSAPLLSWHVKSTTKAQDGLYHYDVVQRLNDSRFGDADVSDIRRYIKPGVLMRAFRSDERAVLLIDEIDKADIEFPNDLLHELDRMSFHIPELNETVDAKHRPIVLISSNAEKELPDAFLRRCVFHYIAFPMPEAMERIVRVHLPDVDRELLERAIVRFYDVRKLPGIKKKPSTSELIDWLMVLIRGGVPADQVARSLPFLGVLLKQEADVDLARRKVAH